MTMKQQYAAFASIGLETWEVAACNQNSLWSISNDDFSVMTIMPSIDASASGCWHGFIKNGEVQ